MSTKKKIALGVLSVILIYVGYQVYTLLGKFPIATGYSAKFVCSCVFAANREADHVFEHDLTIFPINYTESEIDYDNQTVTTTMLGMYAQTAIYRKGFGCTLINEFDEETIREQKFPNIAEPIEPADSIYFPMGNRTRIDTSGKVDYDKLDEAVDWAFSNPLPENPHNTRAVLVVYDGNIILEKYADGFNANTKFIGWSMSKSITNAMVGILVSKEQLDINKAPADNKWADDERKHITLDHLLRMSSGLSWTEEYSKVCEVSRMLYLKGDFYEYASSQPFKHKADSVWYYSSGTSNIVSGIIRNSFKDDKTYWAFPYEELFYKLGMYNTVLETDAAGTYVGSSYSFATARDWARFGMLYLNNGVWQGDTILPTGWVDYTKTPTPGAPKGEYGAHFWTNAGKEDGTRMFPDVPNDEFHPGGFMGQNVVIIPSKKLVIVRLGHTTEGDFDRNYFYGAVADAVLN